MRRIELIRLPALAKVFRFFYRQTIWFWAAELEAHIEDLVCLVQIKRQSYIVALDCCCLLFRRR